MPRFPIAMLFSCSLVAAVLVTSGCRAVKPLVFAENGATNYKIVIARDAPEPVQTAASELSYFLGEMTGATFATVDDSTPAGTHEIVLGATNRKSLADIRAELRPEAWEGFVILPEDRRLHIIGGQIPRGTEYGVYDFLEQELGVRFLAPEVTHVPQRSTLRIDVDARCYDPPFEYRAHYPPNQAREGYGEWMRRSRVNSQGVGSGSVKRLGHPVHTFRFLVPGEHFEKNPEMFALIGGNRTGSTLCLTNPETLRVVTAKAREWAASASDDPGTKCIVQISQNDSGAYCQCATCAAVGEEEDSPFSGPLVRFLNEIARDMATDFPNVSVETLAYISSERPPKKTKLEPNAIVWFAPIRKDSGRAMTEPQINYSPQHGVSTTEKALETWNDVQGWARVCDNLYVWDYPQSFHDFLVPYPSLWPNARNIKLFHELGVKGYFPQQPNSDGSEMRYLRNYMITQLQWRPDQDGRELVEEFCRLYYGEAAGRHILAYIDLMHDTWRPRDRSLFWGGHKYDAMIAPADRILARAAAAAETPEQQARVAEFRLPVWRLMLTRAFGEAGKIATLPRQWLHRADDGDTAASEARRNPTNFDGWDQVEIPTRDFLKADGLGEGWYAVTFDLPETNGAPLALHVAAMKGTWDVYLDGREIAAELPSGLGNYNDVPYVPLGEVAAGRHTLVIKVTDGSGFFRQLQLENPDFTTAEPVTIVDMSKPLSPELRTAAEGFLEASRKAGMVRIYYGYSAMEPYLEKVLWPKIEYLLTAGN